MTENKNVIIEARDQFGELIRDETVFRLLNCDTGIETVAVAHDGICEVLVPSGKYCVKQEKLDEKCGIIVSELFYTKITSTPEKISVENIRPLEIGDFGMVDKEFFKVVHEKNLKTTVKEIEKSGKKVTGFAKHLFNGKSVPNLVILTLD